MIGSRHDARRVVFGLSGTMFGLLSAGSSAASRRRAWRRAAPQSAPTRRPLGRSAGAAGAPSPRSTTQRAADARAAGEGRARTTRPCARARRICISTPTASTWHSLVRGGARSSTRRTSNVSTDLAVATTTRTRSIARSGRSTTRSRSIPRTSRRCSIRASSARSASRISPARPSRGRVVVDRAGHARKPRARAGPRRICSAAHPRTGAGRARARRRRN